MGPATDAIAVVLAGGPPDRAATIERLLERADDRFVVESVPDAETGRDLLRGATGDCLLVVGALDSDAGEAFIGGVRDDRPNLPILWHPDEAVDDDSLAAAFDAGVTDVFRPRGDGTDAALLARRISNAVDAARAAAEADRQRQRLDEFTSGVSHDLRSPLNVAQGRLAMVRNEEDLAHVNDAAAAIDRTLELIEDLLTLAKQGSRPDVFEEVVLSDVADRCWANTPTGDATLVVDTDRRLLANPSRLRQLLANLFRNAVDHGEDDVTVVVGDISPMYTTTRAEADLPVGFFVEDDGPGIPPERRGRVFEPGYTTDADGTGFGLSIVRGVADAHGWEVAASESLRGGARFEVTSVEGG